MKNVNTVQKKQLGQGMTEYIIIVALVAVAAIGAYGAFGNTAQESLANLADEISGKKADISKAGDLADQAHTNAQLQNDMGSYTKKGNAAATTK